MDQDCSCHNCKKLENQVAELEAKVALLQQQVTRDPLTGLLNRRGFDNAMKREMGRAERSKKPFCFASLDLDHFKEVNDTYGHGIGDQVLRELGELLLKDCRDMDTVARVGGEEFGIILSETSIEGAYQYIERLRQKIADTLVIRLGRNKKVRCTASFGVGQFTPKQPIEKLLEKVDDALYTAKAAGRNQVAVASTS